MPWVGLENNNININPSPRFTGTTAHPIIMIDTAFFVKNSGTAPGLHEADIVVAIPDAEGDVPPTAWLQQRCFSAEGISTSPGAANPGAGQMILPGATIPQRQQGTLLLVDPIKSVPIQSTHIKRIWVFVCIAYQDSWGKTIHHSRYWYLTTHGSGPEVPVPGYPGWTYIPIVDANLWGADAD